VTFRIPPQLTAIRRPTLLAIVVMVLVATPVTQNLLAVVVLALDAAVVGFVTESAGRRWFSGDRKGNVATGMIAFVVSTTVVLLGTWVFLSVQVIDCQGPGTLIDQLRHCS
jgi:hypothetical protein